MQEEPIFVLYKLPTVIISRRTDQYSKAYENLMGQVPQQGIPKSRANALPKASSGAAGSQVSASDQQAFLLLFVRLCMGYVTIPLSLHVRSANFDRPAATCIVHVLEKASHL